MKTRKDVVAGMLVRFPWDTPPDVVAPVTEGCVTRTTNGNFYVEEDGKELGPFHRGNARLDALPVEILSEE